MQIKLGKYRHYKSKTNLYQVLGLAKHSETEEELVIYKPLYTNDFLPEGMFMVRPYKMFFEDVVFEGKTIPRFEWVSE
jgi:hypothetical protein